MKAEKGARLSEDVVIIGGGIVGTSTAYYLGKAGIKSVVVERDAIGSHASGFAYGGIGSLGGPGPTLPVAREGVRLHGELSKSLPEETGIDTWYRHRPTLSLAYSDEEAEAAKDGLPWKQEQEGYSVRWVEPAEARSIEPRISPTAVGGVYAEGGAEVDPYRLVLALAQAAEKLGARVRHGRVTGLSRDGGRVRGVTLGNDEISCEQVVLAMGPWTGEASQWLDSPVPVRPLKGQILRLSAAGPPYECSIGWAGNYATSKRDGLVWAGTTEEEVGFDEDNTTEARDRIMAALLKMVPSLAEAKLVQQTACLRPLSRDGLLLLGSVPDWEGVYIATGGLRSGISLGPAMGRITADLITSGKSNIPIDAFDPGRFDE